VKKLAIVIFICSFFMLRPHELQQTGMFYPTDDYGYFAHASAIVYGQFPSYKKEVYFGSEPRPLTGIGPGLMASPLVFVFSLLDRLAGADIVTQRTAENVVHSWSLFGFILASHLYFCLGCFLLYKSVRFYVPDRYAVLSVILMAVCQGLPVYVFRRPVSSPGFEFFLQSLCVYFLFNRVRDDSSRPGYLFASGLGVVIGLMVLTRYNNLAMAAVWPFVILCARVSDFKKTGFWARLSAVFAVAALVVAVFMILPNLFIPASRLSRVGNTLLQGFGPMFYLRRMGHILAGIDWGLIYTAPFLIVGLIGIMTMRFPLRRRLFICLLPMLLNLYVAIMWRTQGGYYGYRFLFPSMIPLLAYPLALGLQRLEKIFKRHTVKVWLSLALLPVLSMVCFLGNQSSLALSGVEQYFGVPGPGNNTFQMEIWEMFLFAPGQLVVVLLKGGFFYLWHMICVMFEGVGILPNIIFIRYPVFGGVTLIKICSLYALPFLLYGMLRRKRKTD